VLPLVACLLLEAAAHMPSAEGFTQKLTLKSFMSAPAIGQLQSLRAQRSNLSIPHQFTKIASSLRSSQ
jgi:hypothetical protein